MLHNQKGKGFPFLLAGILTVAVVANSVFALAATPPAVTTAVTTSAVSPTSTAITATGPAIVPDMNFVGPEIKLSLDQAVLLTLTTSSGIETAKINKMSNLAKTEDYFQTISSYAQQDKMADRAAGTVYQFSYSSTSRTVKEIAKLRADFAQIQSPKNYDAEVNTLKKNAVKQYFETLQAKDTVRIAQDNVKAQETLLKNTNAKFKLGLVAKKDVLSAEVSLNEAKTNLLSAQNGYALAQMQLNQYFGNSVMQKTTLTDSLVVKDPVLIPLVEAITKALASRNEIAGANYGLTIQTLNLKEVGNNFSHYSADYFSAQASLMEAQKTAKDTPAQIEIDVRNKYMQVQAAKASVELGKLNVAKSKESYRMATSSYQLGMMTLVDVQKAQLGVVQSENQLSKNYLTYKLAIIDYEQAVTVGTYLVRF